MDLYTKLDKYFNGTLKEHLGYPEIFYVTIGTNRITLTPDAPSGLLNRLRTNPSVKRDIVIKMIELLDQNRKIYGTGDISLKTDGSNILIDSKHLILIGSGLASIFEELGESSNRGVIQGLIEQLPDEIDRETYDHFYDYVYDLGGIVPRELYRKYRHQLTNEQLEGLEEAALHFYYETGSTDMLELFGLEEPEED